jgi:uncharacterized protein YjbI with pentapeptide repeats
MIKQIKKWLGKVEARILGIRTELGLEKWHPLWSWSIIAGIIVTGYLLYYRFILGWTRWADWTGFGNDNSTRTLWDYLGLILASIATIVIVLLNERNQERRKMIEIDIAADQQRENILRTYLDDMGKMLMEKNLKGEKGKEDSPILDIAQVKTITALRTLDKERRNFIFQFLRDSGLGDFILIKASMSNLNLEWGNLADLNLSGANLIEANLRGTQLFKANLCGSFLTNANLSDAKIVGANLSGAFLDNANLEGTTLYGVLKPRGEIIFATDLTYADLSGTNLRDAKITPEQLTKAKSLKGATLPDGTVHE